MSSERLWYSYRAGRWAVPSDQPASPWYDGGTSTNQSGLAATPRGGYGNTDGDSLTGGDVVDLKHAVIVDTAQAIGGSYPEAAWEPAVLDRDAGSAVTALPTGAYRVAYAAGGLVGPDNPGFSHIGLTESAIVNLVTGVSKPRVTFALPPPSGCRYTLYLTAPGGARWGEYTYCQTITGPYVDLVSGNWQNTYSAGVASGGTVTPANIKQAGAAPLPIAVNNGQAIVIGGAGSLTVADGGYLTMRGDLVFSTPAGGAEDKFIIKGGGRFKFDGSLGLDPTRGNYTMWSSGGCKIFLNG